MHKLILAAIVAFLAVAPQSFAGNCAHSWDSASDGSSCGGRAADQRSGGD